MKASTVVITAHGRVDKSNKVKLPYNLLTSCKIGETHHGSHLDFSKLSIFTNKSFLYNHILAGNDDYTNQGEVIDAGTELPQILLQPCTEGESIKRWSWQKPQIIDHFKKMLVYELKGLPGNPYKISYENMHAFPFNELGALAQSTKNFKLVNHMQILANYEQETLMKPAVLDKFHMASMTIVKNSGICIFDYSHGPSHFGHDKAHDTWSIQEAIAGITVYCNNNGIDLSGVDSYVLKACLE
jgi:hypothetical protein